MEVRDLNPSGASTMDAPAKDQSISNRKTNAEIAQEAQGLSMGKYNGTKVRIGSRIIRIELIKKHDMLPKDPAAQHIRDEVTKNIGSQWKSGTKDIIRGLSRSEEIMFLPNILGLKPEHANWDTATKEFWANFKVPVTAGDGIELEAGFKFKDNSAEEAEPISVDGYMSYQFAQANSNVANEDEDNPVTYTFRLIDTAQQDIKDEQAFSVRKIVDRMFNKLLNDADAGDADAVNTIDWIIETIGGDKGLGDTIYGMSGVKKQLEVEKIKDKSPVAFKEAILDKDLETKALIRKGVKYSKIRHEGTAYFIGNKAMGNGERQAVLWLNDPNNSDEKVMLIAAIKQYMS